MSNENKQSRGPGGRFAGGPGTRTDANAGTNPGTGGGSAASGRNGDGGRIDGPDSKQGQGNSPKPGPGKRTDTNPGTGGTGAPPLSNESTAQGETFVVEQPRKNKGGRPAGFSPKAAQEEKRETMHANNVELANALVMVISGVVQTAFGQYAEMEGNEIDMIANPLVRILDRSTPKTLDQLQKYADPLMLGVGLIAYGARVVSQRPKLVKPNVVPMTPAAADDVLAKGDFSEAIPTGPEVLAQPNGAIQTALAGGLP